VSYTQIAHGTDQLDPDFSANPCTGDPVSGTQTENLVNHVTVKGDELWATFTEEAWVQISDTPQNGSAPITYTGHYTAWGNYNPPLRRSPTSCAGPTSRPSGPRHWPAATAEQP
jgi:hypothetical protein